jgi:hypothetical protein
MSHFGESLPFPTIAASGTNGALRGHSQAPYEKGEPEPPVCNIARPSRYASRVSEQPFPLNWRRNAQGTAL